MGGQSSSGCGPDRVEQRRRCWKRHLHAEQKMQGRTGVVEAGEGSCCPAGGDIAPYFAVDVARPACLLAGGLTGGVAITAVVSVALSARSLQCSTSGPGNPRIASPSLSRSLSRALSHSSLSQSPSCVSNFRGCKRLAIPAYITALAEGNVVTGRIGVQSGPGKRRFAQASVPRRGLEFGRAPRTRGSQSKYNVVDRDRLLREINEKRESRIPGSNDFPLRTSP